MKFRGAHYISKKKHRDTNIEDGVLFVIGHALELGLDKEKVMYYMDLYLDMSNKYHYNKIHILRSVRRIRKLSLINSLLYKQEYETNT